MEDRKLFPYSPKVVFTLMAIVAVTVVFRSALIPRRRTPSRSAEDSKDIDDYIYGLNYTRGDVLVYPGGHITILRKREGNLDEGNNFIVIERIKRSLTGRMPDIGVIASNEHQSYPGSLLLANQRLIENVPDVLAIDRAPLTYTVDLPGMTTDGSFKIIPSFSEYQSSMNKVLKTWFEKYPDDHNVVANFQFDHSLAYSKELLRVKFGPSFINSDIELGIDFSSMDKQEKLTVIHRFKQIFYTVSVEPTKKPSDLFGPNVFPKEVQKKTNEKNPPVIVDSVSYGRTIYVKIETSATDKEAKFILESKLTNFNISYEDEMAFTAHLKKIAITVYVLGGSSDHIELISPNKLKQVNDIIIKYGNFSRNNLGFPISYSTQFVKDNSRALINCFTDYIETTRTLYQKGIVKIVHKGWFVMQWQVTWKLFSYNEAGEQIETERNWEKNWEDLTAPFQGSIEMPGNTLSIRVFAREATGLIWERWRTVIDRSRIPLINEREFSVWGTTLSPQYSINPTI